MIRSAAAKDALAALAGLADLSGDLTAIMQESLTPRVTSNRLVQVLLIVALSPGISPAAVADRMGSSRSLVAQLLRRLIAEDLVLKVAAEEDHRFALLLLTDRGTERVEDLERALTEYFACHRDAVGAILSLLGVDPHEAVAATGSMLGATAAIAGAASGYVRAATQVFSHVGLGSEARLALTMIAGEGPQQPTDLARRLRVTSGAVSGIVDRLVATRLARRNLEPGLADGRAVLVELTQAGQAMAAELAAALEPHATAIGEALRSACAVGTRVPAN
ncbi:hypothetical protein PROP_01253 [Propionicimonas sp. T2.31MG-18]